MVVMVMVMAMVVVVVVALVQNEAYSKCRIYIDATFTAGEGRRGGKGRVGKDSEKGN